MTEFITRHSRPLAAGLSLLMWGLGAAQAQTPSTGSSASPTRQTTVANSERAATVKLVTGRVLAWSVQGPTPRPLVSGDFVQASERVQTGAEASVSLVLRDGTTLMLGPNSALDLREFSFNDTTYNGHLVLNMLKGSLRVITGLIGKNRPESMRITTPTSTIGVLGTDFIVEVGEEQP